MCKKHILSISMCFSSNNEIISNFMCLNLALFSQLFFMWKRIFLVWGKHLPYKILSEILNQLSRKKKFYTKNVYSNRRISK